MDETNCPSFDIIKLLSPIITFLGTQISLTLLVSKFETELSFYHFRMYADIDAYVNIGWKGEELMISKIKKSFQGCQFVNSIDKLPCCHVAQ